MADLLRCQVAAIDGAHLVTLAGEVDISTAPKLAEALAQCADGPVTVDFSDVTYCDSSGLNALLAAHWHYEQRNDRLTIRGAGPMLLRILDISGLDTVFHLSMESRPPTENNHGILSG
jgi:anti-sigma B factor antagonist